MIESPIKQSNTSQYSARSSYATFGCRRNKNMIVVFEATTGKLVCTNEILSNVYQFIRLLSNKEKHFLNNFLSKFIVLNISKNENKSLFFLKDYLIKKDIDLLNNLK